MSLASDDTFFHWVTEEISDYAIFLMDTTGHIVTWNRGAQKLKGYTEEEIVGQYYGMLFPEDKQKAGMPAHELAHAITYGRYQDETWRRKKDGQLFWASVVLTAVHDNAGDVQCLIKITKDLTERKKAEDALYSQNEKLIKLNADLDNFVYTASHDLKSPVLNIAGLVEVFEDEKDPAKHALILQYIKKSVGKLQETILELTNIAKVQKDLEEGNEEKINLSDMLEDIRYSITNQMHEDCPNISTDFQVAELLFSPLNLKSIMANLLSNAIKYRAPDRECQVKISSYFLEDKVVLEVKDNGIGMPKGYEHKVFKMFTRMHNHVEGSGVGLYIIKRIIDNVNGRVEIDSEEGIGTTVRILLQA